MSPLSLRLRSCRSAQAIRRRRPRSSSAASAVSMSASTALRPRCGSFGERSLLDRRAVLVTWHELEEGRCLLREIVLDGLVQSHGRGK